MVFYNDFIITIFSPAPKTQLSNISVEVLENLHFPAQQTFTVNAFFSVQRVKHLPDGQRYRPSTINNN